MPDLEVEEGKEMGDEMYVIYQGLRHQHRACRGAPGRLASRAGKSKAVTATARKIAVLFYNTLRHRLSKDPGADHYEQQCSRVLANLQRRAKSLRFVLQAIPADAKPAVS
jgi:hypothetical protein